MRLASADGTVPVVVTLPMQASEPPPDAPLRAVPAVGGMPLRDAVRELHRAGFRVRVIGSGLSVTTNPLAGTMAAPGALVILSAAR